MWFNLVWLKIALIIYVGISIYRLSEEYIFYRRVKFSIDKLMSSFIFPAVMFKLLKKIFASDKKTSDRRRKRREYKEARKNQYDMPPFFASDFNVVREIDIYVVAFNNAKLIDYQIKFLKKFLAPNYTYIVIDNSFDRAESEKIREICVQSDITYAKVFKPKKIRGTYSASHAMALNWAYEKFVKPRARNFGMIDHDIYPTTNIDVAEYVRNRGLYGKVNIDVVWSLWAGFAFFNWDLVRDKKLDFGRLENFWGKHIGDSGSANWKPVYKKYDFSKIPEITIDLYDIYDKFFYPPTQNVPYAQQLERCLVYMDKRSWVHLNGASGWHEIGNKNDLAFKALDEIYSAQQ